MRQNAKTYPQNPVLLDAKRGDIGNTSTQYAKAFFEKLSFDAVTVAPYMGEDSIRPFLEFENKWTIVLGLTSNIGSSDFQQKRISERYLYEEVIEKVSNWGTKENLMFVTGATKPEEINNIRRIIPDHFLWYYLFYQYLLLNLILKH